MENFHVDQHLETHGESGDPGWELPWQIYQIQNGRNLLESVIYSQSVRNTSDNVDLQLESEVGQGNGTGGWGWGDFYLVELSP